MSAHTIGNTPLDWEAEQDATRLEIAIAAVDALEKRCAELEDQVSTLQNALDTFHACDECGVVFRDYNAYGEHNCQGMQGR